MRTDLWTLGEEEGETKRESNIETYALPHIKQISGGNSLFPRKQFKSGALYLWGGAGRGAAGGGRMEWDVGGKVKRKGKYVHLWFIHVDIWQ